MDVEDERRLVERARRGDLDAYGVLVEEYRSLACRVAYAIAGPDAEDAAQEGFVKAHAALTTFREGAPFRPWVLRIVANEARNRRRAAGRQARLAVRVAGQASSGGAAPSPEEAAIEHERRALLAGAVGALPDRDRDVIVFRFFAGLSESEMAVALGCRPGTVKSRLSRALGRLRALLADRGLEAAGGNGG